MMMKGPLREVIPLSVQKVHIRIPAQRRVIKAHLLVAGKDVSYHEERDTIMVEVPTVNVHEIVALDFAT